MTNNDLPTVVKVCMARFKAATVQFETAAFAGDGRAAAYATYRKELLQKNICGYLELIAMGEELESELNHAVPLGT